MPAATARGLLVAATDFLLWSKLSDANGFVVLLRWR